MQSPPAGRTGHAGLAFLLPSGTPAFASWASCSRQGVRPSSPPAYRRRLAASPDPDGVPTFAMRELRPGWAPPRPRGQRCSHDGEDSPAAACRSSTARPCTPVFIPSPGALGNEASAGVRSRAPVRSSPRLRSRMERARFGFFPELRTPQLPAAHVRAGTGLKHWPGATSPASRRPSSPQAHSQHVTSCRTSSAQSSPTNSRIRSPVLDAGSHQQPAGEPSRPNKTVLTPRARQAGTISQQRSTLPGHRQGHALAEGLKVQGGPVLTCRRPPGTESARCGPGSSY